MTLLAIVSLCHSERSEESAQRGIAPRSKASASNAAAFVDAGSGPASYASAGGLWLYGDADHLARPGMQRWQFFPAYPRPSRDAIFSLPANLATAMLLVDYTAHGSATPTPWPLAVAARLSPAARRDLGTVNAILAHGAILREFALARLPAGAAAHGDWPAFRAWLAGLSASELDGLVDHGLQSGLAYYREHLPPDPGVERLLQPFGAALPGSSSLADPARRDAAARALLASWGAPHPEESLALLARPERLRGALLRFLDELWERGFREAWEPRRAELRAAVGTARARLGAGWSTIGTDELVVRLTGLQPTEDAAGALRRAARIVFVPCLHLGRYLSLFNVADTHYLLYEPPGPGDGVPAREGAAEAGQSPRAREVMDLEVLGQAVVALGDPTRLAILMLLAERGELSAQQIVEALGVHQSTVSRHVAPLERAGLVQARRDGGTKRYTIERRRVRELCQSLIEAIG
jgi:DNA-binding HxlR family transcriptional regulator